MTKITLILITILSIGIGQTFGQTDSNGNPVFNSVSITEKPFDDFMLNANYYTLRNNIENTHSSVFDSENPTLNQVEEAATSLPSDFFILTKDRNIVVMIILENDSSQFMVIEMRTNKQSTFTSNLIGDITENRANEIIKENYDASASIDNGKLMFNGKEFKIIANQDIEDAVLALIKKEKLDRKKPSEFVLRSKQEIKSFVLNESKEGGNLDFFTEIKGKENDGVQIKPGVFSTNQSVALYKWGRACFHIGVNTVDDAYEIFAEHKATTISTRDKEYIRMGFYQEWEK